MTKISTEPAKRAHDVHPAPSGETYTYLVDKFWTVSQVFGSGELLLVTRRGKQHRVAVDDPRLRPARLWERWIYRDRFPKLEEVAGLVERGVPLQKQRA